MIHSTTEITSTSIGSDNPIHQRLLFAYIVAQQYVQGNLLEIGCGVGRGIDLMVEKATNYTALDKNTEVLAALTKKYPNCTFQQANVPPLTGLADNQFDCVVSFQVIEHIEKDNLFLQEIYRVLKPGGFVIITTPNKNLSLSRNPWHVREYTPKEMKNIMEKHFDSVVMKGVHGNEKVMEYYQRNAESVRKITKWDIFNLQYILPRQILQVPYEILNRRNRNKLLNSNDSLVSSIHYSDYLLNEDYENCLDYFCIGYKKLI